MMAQMKENRRGKRRNLVRLGMLELVAYDDGGKSDSRIAHGHSPVVEP